MRNIAIFAVTLSMFAVMMAIITIPVLYSYANHLQSRVIDETDFCKVLFIIVLQW